MARTAVADVPLTLGATVSGNLPEPGAQERYTFTGSTGQRVVFDSLLSEATQINATLINPSGVTVWARNAQSDVEPVSLPESGNYALLIDGVGAAVGPYSFRLLDVATQPEFPVDNIVTDTLSPGNSVRIYRLNGTAGQRLYFDGLGANAGGQWYFYGPNNVYLSNCGIGADFEATLALAGEYVLVLYGTATTPVLFSFQGVTSSVNLHSLSLGPTVAGGIANPGDQEVYTFVGTPGMRVLYDAQDADNLPINARLLTPSGVTLWERNSDADVEPFTLVDAGTYSLVIDGNGSATGPYKFRLLDASKLAVLPLDTIVSDTLSPGISAKVYRFEGTAGQHLYLDGLGANSGGSWYLYGPNNTLIANTSIGADFEITLPLNGTYLLAAWGANLGGPLPFSVQVLTSDLAPGSLALGSTVSGTVSEPGEQHLYTFAGTTGQRIYYDSLDSDSEQVYSRLIAPSGVLVWDFTNQSTDAGPVTLLENGLYTLLIDGNAATTGDFRFRILDLAAAAPLVLGGTTTGTLSPANATLAYQIGGTAGQRLKFDNLSATLNQANWRLIGPANQNITSAQGITTDLGEVVLPVNGTYHLLVEGYTDNVTPLQFQFIASNVSDAPVAVSGLGAVLSGVIAAGQQITNTFTAPAGLWVYFDSQDRSNPGSIFAELRDPLDAVVFSINAYSDSGAYVLPRSGTYRLITKGSSAGATGTYRYRLLDLVGGIPVLPLNTTLSGNLDPAYRTDVYQFTGQAAQRLLYDSLENDFANVSVRLMMPDGQIRFINGNSDTDTAPFTLPANGTYRLFFESQVTTPVSYNSRMLNVESQPLLLFDALVSPTVDPGLMTQLYRFEGTPGQRLYFDGLPSNGAGLWYLYGPNNEQLAGSGLTGDFELVTTTPGRYVLAIFGNSAATVPVTFEVFTPGSGTPVDGLRITAIEVTGGGVELVWDSKSGLTYRVQSKATLSTAGWTDLPGDVTASGPSSTKTDTTAGANPTRFYQVITVP
jgi:hypothetical protein